MLVSPIFAMPRYYNLSPQGDGNNILLNSVLHNNITTYPRKGTETCGHFAHQHKVRITTYPRKGTETSGLQCHGRRSLSLQLIPARGRKPQDFSATDEGLCHYNLSPQGDGNAQPYAAYELLQRLQLIPARGRKHPDYLARFVMTEITTYPRKGTVTSHSLMLSNHWFGLQLIPARGQKSTSATGVCQQRRCFAFSYILFYRLGAVPAGIVFVTGSALTPCGTFRFRGRISCR